MSHNSVGVEAIVRQALEEKILSAGDRGGGGGALPRLPAEIRNMAVEPARGARL